MSPRSWYVFLMGALVLIPLSIGTYKVLWLGVRLSDVLPRTQYRLTYDVAVDSHGSDVRVRTLLPTSDVHQTISDASVDSPGFHFTSDVVDGNHVGTWTSSTAPDGAHIAYSVSALLTPVRFELAPDLPMPTSYPSSLLADLKPEEAIQVDAPEVQKELRRLAADRGSVTARLHRIFDFTSGFNQRPFKGTTDALTALRLGEASCNGKSRLFVALARAAGIPTRLVGGIILESGSKRRSHQWVEAWIGGHWVPFCPTNKHFAELPENYLKLYVGDLPLFSHTKDINFDYRFITTTSSVPSPVAKQWFHSINVWALFERLGFSFALLRTVLMLPIGALVVVLFRNVVGLPTFGTFLPALLAAAAGETGPGWGVMGVCIVVGVVAVVRWLFRRFELLHSPMLAILLAAVTTTLLATTLLAERFDLLQLTRIVLFPIAVLAITAERFYLSTADQGPGKAMLEFGGTVVVMLACYVVMDSHALQALLIGFPEALLLVIAADLYAGRWVGVRLSEVIRFRKLLMANRSTP
jgi:transglutaminase-like putative cysteine protease